MSGYESQTERSSKNELRQIERMAQLMDAWQVSPGQKIANLPAFVRRQEMSYILARWEVFKRIEFVKGNIYYFGVYYGVGFMTLANISATVEPYNHTREIIGFDTFEGYPKIGAKDRSDRDYKSLRVGGFAASKAEGQLNELIQLYDENRPLGHIPKVKLVKGDITKTLPQYLDANKQLLASMIYLTMNLYEPTKLAIELLWPRMPKGGVVVIHSLNEEYYPGVTNALLDTIGHECRVCTVPYAPNLAFCVKGE